VAQTKREKWNNEDSDALFRAVLALRTVDEARRFFRDLLTEKELIEFSHRWKAAWMLDRGVPYKEIERATWMSSTTVARVKRWLASGKGGYRLILARLKGNS